jgi:hypothetical protein
VGRIQAPNEEASQITIGALDGNRDLSGDDSETSSAPEGEQVDTRFLFGFCHTCGMVEVPVPAGYISKSRISALCGGCRSPVVVSDAKILLSGVAKAAREDVSPPNDKRGLWNIQDGEQLPACAVLAGSVGALLCCVVFLLAVVILAGSPASELIVDASWELLWIGIFLVCLSVLGCAGTFRRSSGMMATFSACSLVFLVVFVVALSVILAIQDCDEISNPDGRNACELTRTIIIFTLVSIFMCCSVYIIAGWWEYRNFRKDQ